MSVQNFEQLSPLLLILMNKELMKDGQRPDQEPVPPESRQALFKLSNLTPVFEMVCHIPSP